MHRNADRPRWDQSGERRIVNASPQALDWCTTPYGSSTTDPDQCPCPSPVTSLKPGPTGSGPRKQAAALMSPLLGYAPKRTNRDLARSGAWSTIGASGKTERLRCALAALQHW